MSASTARLEHVADVFTAEAAALLEGLKLARDTGCNNLVVRSDNITVVDALRFNEGYSMVAAPVLVEKGSNVKHISAGLLLSRH